MAGKKWRTVYPGGLHDDHRSERLAYEFVEALRSSWTAGMDDATGSVTVQVDERLGAGWQPYEHINFAEEN